MKPRIALIADRPGWAYDIVAKNIVKELSNKYFFKIYYIKDMKRKNWVYQFKDKDKFDLFYVFNWNWGIDIPKERAITGLHSHYSYESQKMDAKKAAKIINKKYGFVGAISKILVKKFNKKIKNLFYTPHGIDTGLFKPKKIKGNKKFVAGYSGSIREQGNKKGYFDFLLPAIKHLDGVELKTAIKERKGRRPTQKGMVDFYNSIDCLICASRTEGGPLPVLESAACGKAVISTKVGIVPELIKNGYNGLVVKRNIMGIRKAIEKLRDDRELCRKMGNRNRQKILKNWTWKRQAKKWDKMFICALKNGR